MIEPSRPCLPWPRSVPSSPYFSWCATWQVVVIKFQANLRRHHARTLVRRKLALVRPPLSTALGHVECPLITTYPWCHVAGTQAVTRDADGLLWRSDCQVGFTLRARVARQAARGGDPVPADCARLPRQTQARPASIPRRPHAAPQPAALRRAYAPSPAARVRTHGAAGRPPCGGDRDHPKACAYHRPTAPLAAQPCGVVDATARAPSASGCSDGEQALHRRRQRRLQRCFRR